MTSAARFPPSIQIALLAPDTARRRSLPEGVIRSQLPALFCKENLSRPADGNGCDRHLSAFYEGNIAAIERHVGGEQARSAYRIHQPERLSGNRVASTFLTNDGILRECAKQIFPNSILAGDVRCGYQIDTSFGGDRFGAGSRIRKFLRPYRCTNRYLCFASQCWNDTKGAFRATTAA